MDTDTDCSHLGPAWRTMTPRSALPGTPGMSPAHHQNTAPVLIPAARFTRCGGTLLKPPTLLCLKQLRACNLIPTLQELQGILFGAADGGGLLEGTSGSVAGYLGFCSNGRRTLSPGNAIVSAGPVVNDQAAEAIPYFGDFGSVFTYATGGPLLPVGSLSPSTFPCSPAVVPLSRTWPHRVTLLRVWIVYQRSTLQPGSPLT